MRSIHRLIVPGIMALVLLAGVMALSPTAQAQLPWSVFDRILADEVRIVRSGLTIDEGGFTVADGGITVSEDGLAITGDLTQSDGDVVVADDLRVTAQTAVSLTQDATLTATGSYQPLAAAAGVSTASIAAGTAGDLLVIINTTSNTITFSDTGTLKLSGNAVLGQFDSLTLWSDGTNWVELAQTDN